MNIRHLTMLSLSLLVCASASAFDDDDDDIYYNPSKSKKTETTKAKTAAEAGYYYVPNQVVNYQDPALNQPTGTGLPVDVDAYNRHGQFLVQGDSITLDQFIADEDAFAYTRRIERFHNEDIVNGSDDQELIDYYYNQPATTADVNIYVVNSDPWGWNTWNTWGGYYPWYSPYSSYWYNPYWYNSFYGPSWNFSWGYDPWYSWSFAPGYWSPGYWGPGYWGPGYIGGGFRPYPTKPSNVAINNPGSSRPHAAAGSSSGSTIGRRPGAISVGASNPVTRPGSAATSPNRYTGTITPGTAASRPGMSTGSGASTNLNRGRGSITTTPSNTPRQMNTTTTRPASNSSSSRPGWNSSSSSSSSSRSSYNSGSSRSTGGSGFGGGSRGNGSGGGSTRGRR